MNWDRVEGKWKHVKGSARSKWGKLTDNDLDLVAGKKDKFVGLLQERYGIAKDEAEKQIDEWLGSLGENAQASRSAEARGGERSN